MMNIYLVNKYSNYEGNIYDMVVIKEVKFINF